MAERYDPEDFCECPDCQPKAAPVAPRTAGWDIANPDAFGKVPAAPAAPEQPARFGYLEPDPFEDGRPIVEQTIIQREVPPAPAAPEQRLQKALDEESANHAATLKELARAEQELQTLREQQSKRMDILLDDNCIATIKRLTPTGGEEISFGGVMGGVRLLWNEAALGEKGSKS